MSLEISPPDLAMYVLFPHSIVIFLEKIIFEECIAPGAPSKGLGVIFALVAPKACAVGNISSGCMENDELFGCGMCACSMHQVNQSLTGTHRRLAGGVSDRTNQPYDENRF